MELDDALDRLAHATWCPEGRQYLLSAVSRLQALLGDNEVSEQCGISLEMLQTLSSQVTLITTKSSSDYARLKPLSDDTSAQKNQHHPFFKIRDTHPGFILLLTSLPSDHHLSKDLDQLLAEVNRIVLRLNLSVELDTYQASAKAVLRSRLQVEPISPEDCQPSAHLLRILSRSLRRFIKTALLDQNSPEVDIRWEQFQKTANSFLSNPHRPRRHIHRPKGLKRETRPGTRHRDGPELLNVRSPVHLESIDFAPVDLSVEQVSEPEKHVFERGTFSRALTLDLSPLEIEPPTPEIGTMVHEHHSRKTAVIEGRYQAKQLENRAQLLLWSTSNLTPLRIRTLRENLLVSAREMTLSGFNAAWLLIALISGRRPSQLPGKVVLDNHIRKAEDLARYNDQNLQVVFLTSIQGIALHVNKTPVMKKLKSPHVQETLPWIIVPDYLEVGDLIIRHLRNLQIGEDLTKLKLPMLRQSIEHALDDLRSIGFTESNVWQLLPRIMQNESGMNTGVAMLTDWRTANSIVDLHYHCVPSMMLVSRYQAAMSIISEDFDGRYFELEQRQPKQTHFVGAPNCPTPKFTQNLIKQIKDKLNKPLQLQERHNLLTLYTLLLATAGFGLRHAISPEIKFTSWSDRAIVSYVEKGELRQFIVPRIVSAQLPVIQNSYKATSFDADHLHQDGLVRFTLLDDKCRSREFRPGRFGKELAVFGIEFPFELNAYRRWMFSQLFMSGLRGISIDHFGGHGVAGREPFSIYSATTLNSLERVADLMDQRLADAGFEVLR